MPFNFKLIEMKGHLISLYEFKNILVSVLLPVTSGLLPVIEYESWWCGDNPRAIRIRRILLGKIWWHNLISLILWCLIFRQLNFASTNCLVFQMKSGVLVSWQRPKQDIDTVLWTDQLSAIFTKRIFREFNWKDLGPGQDRENLRNQDQKPKNRTDPDGDQGFSKDFRTGSDRTKTDKILKITDQFGPIGPGPDGPWIPNPVGSSSKVSQTY